MQNFRLFGKINLPFLDAEVDLIAQKRAASLGKVARLKAAGCAKPAAIAESGLSKSTFYRHSKALKTQGLAGLAKRSSRPKNLRKPCWSLKQKELVLALRKKFRLWGKAKIATILKRDHGEKISESTVGRMLSYFVKRQAILPASFFNGQKPVKKRVFNRHAQRWHYDLKAQSPGQMLQIDHMKVDEMAEKTLVVFDAVCPVSKWATGQAFGQATSQNAATFLANLLTQIPFPLKSIQVDGGSEFMKHFEAFCAQQKLDLYVLPPRSPQKNGNVERVNSTFKYEFFQWYDGPADLASIQENLDEYCFLYNSYRPHQGLQQATPLAYLNQWKFMGPFFPKVVN